MIIFMRSTKLFYRFMTVLLLFMVLSATFQAKLTAKDLPLVQVSASPKDTHVRFRFTFKQQTDYELEVSDGLFAVRFDTPHDFEVGDVENNSYGMVIAHRLDPDKKGLRFALGGAARVVDQAAAEFLIIDLLPLSWQGEPPVLPGDVINILKKRAEDSVRQNKQTKRSSRQSVVERPLVIKAGENPTFTRIVIEGYGDVDPSISRVGDELHLDFPFDNDVNIDQIRRNMPRGLDAINLERFNNNTTIIFKIDPKREIRSLAERTRFLIDILGFDHQGNAKTNNLAVEDGLIAELTNQNGRDDHFDTKNQQVPTVFLGKLNPVEITNDEASGALPKPSLITKVPINTPDPSVSSVNNVLQTEPTAAIRTDTEAESDIKHSEDTEISVFKAKDVQDQSSLISSDEALSKPVPTTEANRDGHFALGISDQSSALAFTRGRQLYLGFDPNHMDKWHRDVFADSDLIEAVNHTTDNDIGMIFITLKAPEIAAIYTDKGQWWLDIEDIQSHERTVRKVERINDGSGIKVIVPMNGARNVIDWQDPMIGDNLKLILASAPAQPVYQVSDTAEFKIYASLHGAVIAPKLDGVDVKVGDDTVIIAREGGLKASSLLTPPIKPHSGADKLNHIMKFKSWHGKARFVDDQSRALSAITDLPSQQASEARLELAKFYTARNMPAEALGALKVASQADLLIKKTGIFSRVEGIAHLLAGNTAKADKILKATPLIVHDIEMAPWLGLLAAQKGHAEDAFLLMDKAMPLIDTYPQALQIPLRFAFFDNALEIGQFNKAEEALFFLNRLPLQAHERAHMLLLKARLADKLGKNNHAEKYYSDSIGFGYPPVESQARLDEVDFALRHNKITVDEAIETLQRISFAWRGGAIEVDSLVRTADLLVNQKRYAEAFDLSRVLGKIFPYELKTTQLRERLTKVFTDLYLGPRRDDIDVLPKLSIFYDYAEFTPVGKQGDQIIRYLAEQLFELNLLDQATTLLDYQVKNRLKGAARAEVAADVALMHLMNNKPGKAIKILHETRQAAMPKQVDTRRLLLESQALLALLRPDSARELIRNIEGTQAELIRIDTDLALKNWQSLGERSENFLGERWRDGRPLDEAERKHVLRAVVSYALADDDLGIRRVQQKFAPAMSASQDAAAFNVLTDVAEARGQSFSEIAEKIASTSNFEAFIKASKAEGLSFSKDTTRAETEETPLTGG